MQGNNLAICLACYIFILNVCPRKVRKFCSSKILEHFTVHNYNVYNTTLSADMSYSYILIGRASSGGNSAPSLSMGQAIAQWLNISASTCKRSTQSASLCSKIRFKKSIVTKSLQSLVTGNNFKLCTLNSTMIHYIQFKGVRS